MPHSVVVIDLYVADERPTEDKDYSIREADGLENNESQHKAINAAMNNRLTLIQGPPG